MYLNFQLRNHISLTLNQWFLKHLTKVNVIQLKLIKEMMQFHIQKIEDKNFNKYYQYGSIREPSFTSSHSVTNCGEIWSAYNAILDGAKFKDLSFRSVYSRSGAYLDMCENCQHTFVEYLMN